MNTQSIILPDNGAVIDVPLNRLKVSPRNARRTPHAAADIEALAASIAAKGMIQPLVVEPEVDGAGKPTGDYLVTVGEGRRQAMCLRAKRKEIRKDHPVRCIVDLANDAHEISLDENITRFAMHPADQFEAFRELAERRSYGPEEIAARFGVTPTVVRQRLKLAAASPNLLAVYRAGDMTLDQLMAFTLTDDHARQEDVWARLSWNKEPALIRRLLTEDRVRGSDRRAVFIGPEAYLAAGGVIERDLFSDDQGGYFVDPGLLDRLALEKLAGLTEGVLADGWRWAAAYLEPPPSQGLRRVYARTRDLPAEDQARYEALSAEYDGLLAEHEADEEIDPEVEAKAATINGEMEALDRARLAYDPDDVARAGAFLVLGHDGAARIEVGFVRPEDEPPPDPQTEEAPDDGEDASPETHADDPAEDDGEEDLSRIPDRLIADLTAHRTAALCDRLGEDPEIALLALIHTLAHQTFSPQGAGSCLELRVGSVHLPEHALGIRETRAGKAIEARHAAWAAELPSDAVALWKLLLAMERSRRLSLLAHCLGMTVNAVQAVGRPKGALLHADQLAAALALDMADYWTPTVESYLGRVTKAHILAAVREGVSEEAARRLDGLKKQPMAETAEGLLAGKRWLPEVLRPEPQAVEPVAQAAE